MIRLLIADDERMEREALAEKRRQRMQEEIAKNNMKGGIDVLAVPELARSLMK